MGTYSFMLRCGQAGAKIRSARGSYSASKLPRES